MVAVSVRGLRKVFAGGVVAVDALDLDVASGEFLVLLGPTGCGKSTVLRLIAGLEEPTAGSVRLDGVPVADLPPGRRDVALVQGHTLYPHLTVAQNIGFPLRAGGDHAGEVAARVTRAARQVGVADLLGRLPAHLSGGQRQRVAMARALVRRPGLLLLDEPMSDVDAPVRAELRAEILALSRRLGVTTVYVTHDQGDAMGLADRVAVLRRGVLQQVGEPARVYADPDTVFVAAFLGHPRTSLLQAAVFAGDDGVRLDLGGQVLTLPPGEVLARHDTERVTVGLRALRPGGDLRGVVRTVENLGHETLAGVDVGGVPTPPQTSGLTLADDPGEIVVRLSGPDTVRVGDRIGVAVRPADVLLFDRAGNRIRFLAGTAGR